MRSLAAPIQLKNVTKIAVDKLAVFEDDTPPHALVDVHLEDNDGLLYFSATLAVYDSVTSDVLVLKSTPLRSSDKVTVAQTVLTGAYTALVNSAGTLHGSAKRSAVESACASIGIFGTGLT